MNATYLQHDVSLDPDGRTVHARFGVRNDTGEAWRAAEGFGFGYHLFDADTGTLIIDGARVHPAGDVKPGETARVQLDFELPAEDGRYQVLLSAMRENVCWYYEQGWPFLLVEGATERGAARLERVRVANARALGRSRALRALGRAFYFPVLTIWRNHGLIRVMVRRDVLGRYRGSFGGSFWTVINPLLLMLTYLFVFGFVLDSKFPGDPSKTGFALYYLAGMLPWLAFSEAVGRAPGVMLEHRNFVKKLVFAVETLPVNLVVSGLVNQFFAVLLYCAFLLAVRHRVPASVLWLPVLLVPQILFTAGLSWFLAALGVFARDLGQIMGFVMTIWFFITPICYAESSLPKAAVPLMSKNPIYVLVRGYRTVFLENHAPDFGPLWKLWLLAAVVFILGHAWFYKLRKSFADMM
ncbi:MAG TPA: ABC transporter permease [Candidatus Acidoferrales bacterium]|jgi:lipopolysaccharide transport system permease protein|nr:ABC transporter permease [Candidatus Acidoferrales bacterium]